MNSHHALLGMTLSRNLNRLKESHYINISLKFSTVFKEDVERVLLVGEG